jgi:hypothetical protein
MSKSTKTRRPNTRPGISNLSTPAECVGVQNPNEPPSAVCHVALRCQRCKLCAYHCSCWAELEPPVTQPPDGRPQLLTGPQRKQAEAVQMDLPMNCYLCKQPISRPDVYVVAGPNKWSEPDDPHTWPLEPAHQGCLDRAVELVGQS